MARTSKYLMENIQVQTPVWHVGAYIRLSREDEGDKDESNSVTNQKLLLNNYIQEHEEFNLYDYFIDDGYTGTNFNRPEFQRMMKLISQKEINCIIVKDLSRFGRDYIQTGEYLEKIFPSLGIRFIAINDGIDTNNMSKNASDVTPFRSILNDMYAKDISNKVRSIFDVKRKEGQFIGAFAPYGYKKDELNKHKLIIDEEAANVVKKIFDLFIQGMPKLTIAKHLNELNIPCPTEYKKRQGMKYKNSNKLEVTSYWTYSTINKILSNPVYIGHMVQKKEEVISYKVKNKRTLNPNQWIVVKNTHEPIIDIKTWTQAQDLLNRDTRKLNVKNIVSLFAGYLKCADCGRAMHRKYGTKNSKQYYYYICGTYKNYGKNMCSSHMIHEKEIEEIVLKAIKEESRIALMVDKIINIANKKQESMQKKQFINIEIGKLEKEQQKIYKLKKSIYEDWKLGELTKEEYMSYKSDYENQEKEIISKLEKLREVRNEENKKIDSHNDWVEAFKKHSGITEIDRSVVVELIDKIIIKKDGSIEIVFKYKNAFVEIIDEINSYNQNLSLNTSTLGRVQFKENLLTLINQVLDALQRRIPANI